MNRFCGCTRPIAAGIVGFLAFSAYADKTPQLLGDPVKIAPVRLAGFRWLEDGGRIELTTPWLEYGQGGAAQACQTMVCFDNFEPGADGCASGGYDPDCGLGGQRWFFGPDYCNTYAVNDMTLAANCAGGRSERIAFAWYWTAGGAGTSEQCLVAVFTAEDFDTTCAGPPFAHSYAGIIYSFGFLAGEPSGFYSTEIPDLCDFGLFHQMPQDGQGAYGLIFAQDVLPGGTFAIATCAQPMLWGTKTGPACARCRNPSAQGPIQWDIDYPDWEPGDCSDYSFGVCPDPLGAVMLFYGPEGCPACPGVPGDVNCDGAVDFFDIDGMIAAVLAGAGPDCDGNGQPDDCVADCNGDGVVDFFDLDACVACILTGGC